MGGEGIRQLASVKVNTCRAKNSGICRRSTAAVLATGVLSRAGHWKPLPLCG